jgi:hypothetical protein
MDRILTLILILATLSGLKAQLSDDFSDGNITSSPTWSGDVGHFIVNPQSQLQLNAPTAGSSRITTPITLPDSAEWHFYFQMAFAPSATNRQRIFLLLDQEEPGVANGYGLDIGENGSADALRFFRIDAGAITELASSAGIFGADPSTSRIQVTRNSDGHWTFTGDQSGGSDFSLLFTADDLTHLNQSGQFFGIECVYTDTRKDKFFFDDIYVGDLIKDTSPPVVTQFVVQNATHLRIQFNEPLATTIALDPGRYHITPDIGQPQSVEFAGTEQSAIVLTSPQSFVSGTPYTLSVDQLQDLLGNAFDTAIVFTFIQIAQQGPYDILINEIMADPSPVVGLPNAEYVELYNRGTAAFQLENYSLTVGSQLVLLPPYILAAGAYVLIVDDGAVDLFSAYPNTIAPNLPALTNTGTTLELADDLGNTLHRISYTLSSYQDAGRDDGGWSLELINPLALCALDGNLRASQDLTGGTPGRQNSVSENPVVDTEGPILLSIFPLSTVRVQFVFDEILSDFGYAVSLKPDHFITSYEANENILEITLQTPMQMRTLYTFTVHTVTDCLGNIGENQILTSGLPESAEERDIVINEILFDPASGGSRFIEVYNVSQKFIDLNELVIADVQGDTIAAFPVAASFLLEPFSVAAFTPNVAEIRSRYFMHDPGRLIETTLPAFDRTSGNATIYTRSGVILDAFDYDESFHNVLLDDTRGVSLERTGGFSSTQNRSSWFSAAATAGYGTPGLPNSQRIPQGVRNEVVELSPETFSPDGDGFDDFLSIFLKDPPLGSVARIRIFDTHGREIARVAENVLTGSESVFRWDGATSEGERARIGPHVVWVELVFPNGGVEHYKKTCVVAEKL